MSPRRDRSGLRSDLRHNYYLKEQSKLPGPGSYSNIDLVGTNIANSTLQNSRKSTIPTQGRFMAPTEKVKSPSPDLYSP